MNREDTKVVPFRTAASPYNAEIEKKRNVIGQQLAKAVRDCGYSKKAFCEVLKNYGVDVTHSALGKWTNGLTVPSAYQLVAICHALHIEEGISYFTGSYVSELNEVGMAKMRSYRDDLIASGRYRPQSKDDNQIRYISKAVSNLCVSAGTGAVSYTHLIVTPQSAHVLDTKVFHIPSFHFFHHCQKSGTIKASAANTIIREMDNVRKALPPLQM